MNPHMTPDEFRHYGNRHYGNRHHGKQTVDRIAEDVSADSVPASLPLEGELANVSELGGLVAVADADAARGR